MADKDHLFTKEDYQREQFRKNKKLDANQFSTGGPDVLGPNIVNIGLRSNIEPIQDNFPRLGDATREFGSVTLQTVNIDFENLGARYNIMTVDGDITFAFNNIRLERKVNFILDITLGVENPTITYPATVFNIPSNVPTAINSRYLLEFEGYKNDTEERYYVVGGINGTAGGTLPLGTALNDHIEWDGAAWQSQQFLEFNSTGPFAGTGFIRFANDNISIGFRNVLDDGDIQIKLNSSDVLDFTESNDGPMLMQIRSQHASDPDNILGFTVGSGAASEGLIDYSNEKLNFGVNGGNRLQLDGTTQNSMNLKTQASGVTSVAVINITSVHTTEADQTLSLSTGAGDAAEAQIDYTNPIMNFSVGGGNRLNLDSTSNNVMNLRVQAGGTTSQAILNVTSVHTADPDNTLSMTVGTGAGAVAAIIDSTTPELHFGAGGGTRIELDTASTTSLLLRTPTGVTATADFTVRSSHVSDPDNNVSLSVGSGSAADALLDADTDSWIWGLNGAAFVTLDDTSNTITIAPVLQLVFNVTSGPQGDISKLANQPMDFNSGDGYVFDTVLQVIPTIETDSANDSTGNPVLNYLFHAESGVGSNRREYANFKVKIEDNTDLAEDGSFRIAVIEAGTEDTGYYKANGLSGENEMFKPIRMIGTNDILMVDNNIQFKEKASPSPPAATFGFLYAKVSGGNTRPFWINNTEAEVDLTAGSGGLPHNDGDGATDIIQNTSDSTKKIRYNLTPVSASAVKTFTFVGGATASYTFQSLGGLIASLDLVQTWGLNKTQKFQSGTGASTLSGFNLIPVGGDPATSVDGDVWYSSSLNKFRAKENGVVVNLRAGDLPHLDGNGLTDLVRNTATATKNWRMDLSPVDINTEKTFTWVGGTDATYTFQSLGGTMASIDLAQTWTAIQTHNNNIVMNAADIDLSNRDLLDVKVISGHDSGQGSFKIIFDAAEDNDTRIQDSATLDVIDVFCGDVNMFRFTPTTCVCFQDTQLGELATDIISVVGELRVSDADLSNSMRLQTVGLSTNRTHTFPDFSGTVAELALAQTWSAVQTFNASPIGIDLSSNDIDNVDSITFDVGTQNFLTSNTSGLRISTELLDSIFFQGLGITRIEFEWNPTNNVNEIKCGGNCMISPTVNAMGYMCGVTGSAIGSAGGMQPPFDTSSPTTKAQADSDFGATVGSEGTYGGGTAMVHLWRLANGNWLGIKVTDVSTPVLTAVRIST